MRGHVKRVNGLVDAGHRQLQAPRRSDYSGRTAQGCHITHHKAPLQCNSVVAVGLGNDFGANTRSISHGDGEWLQVCRGL